MRLLFTSSRTLPRTRRNPGPLIDALDTWLRAALASEPPIEDWCVRRVRVVQVAYSSPFGAAAFTRRKRRWWSRDTWPGESRSMWCYRRRRPDARFGRLRAVPMFAGLPDAALRRVDRQLVELEVPAGTVLTRQHEFGREAFIVVEGRAGIAVDGAPVSSVAVGELIGEIALLDCGGRTATVTALTPMRLYVLDPTQFGALFDEPQTSRWIAAHLARRLRAQTVPAVG